MGSLIAGMASSHAYALDDPDTWDARRVRTRKNFEKRYGWLPDELPEANADGADRDRARFVDFLRAFELFKARVSDVALDALVIVGDDQDENFTGECRPQFAVHTGATFDLDSSPGVTVTCKNHTELAAGLLTSLVEGGIDAAECVELPKGKLLAHAHAPIIQMLAAELGVPVVLVFVNAIHVPAPSPARCYEAGRIIRNAIDGIDSAGNVAIYASGGLSHFTAGYPWPHYQGSYQVGSISVEFDRHLIEKMRAGEGEELSKLSSADLLANGDVEFRQWLVLLGALGAVKPDFLHYEPFFRALTGMAVGYWPVVPANGQC
jgi:hypothetical protein